MTAAAKPETGTIIIVPVELRVAAATIESLIISALEGGVQGIDYWCTNSRVRKPYAIPGRQHYAHAEFLGKNLAAGGVIQLHEESEGDVKKWHTLSLKKLKRGIAMWVQHGFANSDYMKGLDPETGALDLDIDGPQSDVILQFALFGELRYA